MKDQVKKLVCEFMANDEIMSANFQYSNEELEEVADYTTEVCLYVLKKLTPQNK